MRLDRTTTSVIALAILLLALDLTGCTMDPGDAAPVDGLHDYPSSPSFTKVSSAPYLSELADDIRIDVWVSTGAAAAYAQIIPDASGSGVHLPEGTVIIREVHDAATGDATQLTVMVKGPPGHAPEIGDWWYAVTDMSGVPLRVDGRWLSGDLTQCYDCHTDRDDDDFLFGVPRAARRL